MDFADGLGRITGVSPAPGMLPPRHWRWIWASIVLRLLVAFPFLALMIPPYLVARGLVWVLDWTGSQLGGIQVKAYNHDLASSGWSRPQPKAPALRLSDEWEARLRGRRGDDSEVRGVPAADVPAGDE